jgi:hypothetical protein
MAMIPRWKMQNICVIGAPLVHMDHVDSGIFAAHTCEPLYIGVVREPRRQLCKQPLRVAIVRRLGLSAKERRGRQAIAP